MFGPGRGSFLLILDGPPYPPVLFVVVLPLPSVVTGRFVVSIPLVVIFGIGVLGRPLSVITVVCISLGRGCVSRGEEIP
mgnify:CR=1 FL=1